MRGSQIFGAREKVRQRQKTKERMIGFFNPIPESELRKKVQEIFLLHPDFTHVCINSGVKSTVIIGAIVITLLISSVSNVSATGIRHDSGDDATDEEHGCHIDGYDSGFAGKYDSDRARECVEHDDNYNQLWAYGCEDSLRTEEECGELINNPVEIEDYEALKTENDRTCYDAGQEDGKAGKPYNKDRASG
ncbi:MAG: hypothetical protein ACRD8W_26330, partial [Nitrososphaeraceae archaeon]